MAVTLPRRFETKRLLLRESAPADATAIYDAYATDAAVTRFLTWPPHRSIADTHAYLALCETARRRRRSNIYVLVRRDGRPHRRL